MSRPDPAPTTRHYCAPFADVAERLVDRARHRDDGLSSRDAALIEVAVFGNASLTVPALLDAAIERAFDEGATESQIAAVLQLSSQVGFQGIQLGAPMLLDHTGIGPAEVRAADRPFLTEAVDGVWASSEETLAGFVALDPEFTEIMMESIARSWRADQLDHRLTELIYVAFDATSTHMFASGLHSHMRKALRAGATPAQVMQVLELTASATLSVLEANLHRLRTLAEGRDASAHP